jgi:hypothetical protein
MLRALGEALGALPDASLDSSALGQIAHVFAVANAPCQIAAAAAPAERRGSVARQLLNPSCSEESWIRLATVFGVADAPAKKDDDDDDDGPDFNGLSVLHDDDGQPDSPEGYAVKSDEIRVDFNRLSQALDSFRHPDAMGGVARSGKILSGVLLLVGLLCFAKGKLRRNSLDTDPMACVFDQSGRGARAE